MNPLLDFSGLPRFSEIRTEHVSPAAEQLLMENRALVASLLHDAATPSWDNFMQPLADANERLSRTWGQVGHLNAVMNAAALREAYNANLPKITQYYAELGQNLGLFNKVKAIRDGAEFAGLSTARQKIIGNELRDFRLGGAELPEDKKARFLAIQEEQSTLCSKFSDNLLDATNAYSWLVTDEAELSGIPADERQVAAEAAQEAGKSGWLFTLKAPSYLPLMQYADNRALRERMYRAYVTRASELEKTEFDNTQLMAQILKPRRSR
ncbi:MAG: oligopeptidase A [Gallionellaceae bacterium]|nr:MAG: oligopeptidase A [Gallionellaceae bacterium]